MLRALGSHWREYLIEAVLLGGFMVAASSYATVLQHPASPVRQAIEEPLLRRALMGLAMGLTLVAIVYSPLGRRSGAHLNPATTLVFLRLGRIAPSDAALYIAAQFTGALAGITIAAWIFEPRLAGPPLHYLRTMPGMRGVGVAFAAELVISFVLATAVLRSNASARTSARTGLVAGALLAAFILVEQPLSGTSMNPARSFGSATAAADWTALWVYLTAPPLGMLAAAQLFLRRTGHARTVCAKLRPHRPGERCHFCEWADGTIPPESHLWRAPERMSRAAPVDAGAATRAGRHDHIRLPHSRSWTMKRRNILIAGLLVAGIAGWYAFRPERLFIDTTVSEALAVAPGDAAGAATVLASGTFHDVSHETRGTAAIHGLPGGRRVLRLTDFATSNGPDVRVYLVAASDASDNETVTRAGFVELGRLKGNQGDQNYDVPGDLDLSRYRAVTIWCKRFGVNFGTAPLSSM